MRFLKEKRELICIIVLMISVIASGVHIAQQQRELDAAKAAELSSIEKIVELVQMLPANNAAWWKRGCEEIVDGYMHKIGSTNIDLSLDLFLFRLQCQDLARDVEKELIKTIFESEEIENTSSEEESPPAAQ